MVENRTTRLLRAYRSSVLCVGLFCLDSDTCDSSLGSDDRFHLRAQNRTNIELSIKTKNFTAAGLFNLDMRPMVHFLLDYRNTKPQADTRRFLGRHSPWNSWANSVALEEVFIQYNGAQSSTFDLVKSVSLMVLTRVPTPNHGEGWRRGNRVGLW